MKMISSAKVHKFELELKRLLPFRDQIETIMGHLLETNTEFDSPLLTSREVKNVGIVVFGSDDGLCGAYNINIFKYLLIEISRLKEKYGKNFGLTIIPVGKKMINATKKLSLDGIEIKELKDVDSKMDASRVNEFTRRLMNNFKEGEFDLVEVIFMKFYSMSRQRPQMNQIFPVNAGELADESKGKGKDNKFYIFEPNPNRIFNEVLPMHVLSTMQEIAIENRASEQAARVMAMQSANDNAKKLLEELQLEYNKLRQQAITTELLDILGGQIER